MLYSLAADLLVFIHLAFIAFVVFGGLLVLKWPRLGLLHIPACVWGALIEFQSGLCPLTPWEQHLRLLAGQTSYSGSFIQHYLMPLLYPAMLTRELQIILGCGVVIINFALYAVLISRLLKKRNNVHP